MIRRLALPRPLKAVLFLPLLLPLPLAGAEKDAEPERVGAIVGTVVNRVTLQPVPGALVLVDGSAAIAETDAEGRFQVHGLPVGSYRLLVTHTDHLSAHVTDVVVTANRETSVDVALQQALTRSEEVEVTASYFQRPLDLPSDTFSLSYEEVRRAPGALGDIGRMIQSFPGAAARDDQRNDIVARGGSPAENLMIVDGIEVPTLSHFGSQGSSGGPITMLSPEIIGQAEFLPGGFPAQYGNRLSSVLEVSVREGSRQGFEGEFDLSMAGAGLLLEGPIGSRGSWLVSGRRSYIDLIASAYGISAIPEYSNYQAKASYEISPGHRIKLISLGGRDSINFDTSEMDEDDPETFDVDFAGWRTSTGLVWQAFLGAHGVSTLSISHSASAYRSDAWDTLLDDQLVSHNDSLEQELVAKYSLTFQLPRLGTLSAGLDARRLQGDFEISQPIGQENPFSSDPTRVNEYSFDETYSAYQGGGYLQAALPMGRWATVSLGGRYDYFDANREGAFSPRASLTFHPLSNLDLSLAWGRYHQNPELVLIRSQPGNTDLQPIRADHYVAGVAWYPSPGTKLSVQAYTKDYFGYPVAIDYPAMSLANVGDLFDISGYLLPLTSQGRGRSRGIEVDLQKKLTGSLYGQISYARSQTENRALDGVWRPSTFDLPHVLSVVAGYRIGKSLELSSKFSYTSGRPFTPFLEEASREQNREVLDMTRFYAERGPTYHRLDLRADKRSTHGWGNLVYYLEVQNVYDHENGRYYFWNRKEGHGEWAPQVSRLFIGGINIEF
jgi:outer membrane receptor protein involved in Fe transport